nr:Chain O, Octapeptide GLYASKLA [synthetic construct]
GLYASKLA